MVNGEVDVRGKSRVDVDQQFRISAPGPFEIDQTFDLFDLRPQVRRRIYKFVAISAKNFDTRLVRVNLPNRQACPEEFVLNSTSTPATELVI